MLKKFLGAIISSLILVFALYYFRFDMEVGAGYINVLDSFFTVGITYFFFGLITLSNAGQVFKSTGFVLKNMFLPGKRKYRTYYDQLENNPNTKEKSTGLATMTVGLIIVIINVIFSYIYFL